MFPQQNGEDEAVKTMLSLPMKWINSCFIGFPPILPLGAGFFGPLHGRGDVPNGGVEPYVEDLPVCIFDWDGTPQSRSRVMARLCSPLSIQLRHWPLNVRLPVDASWCGLAFERAVFDVLLEPPFVTAHGQVPQGGVLEYRRGAAQSGGGVDEVGGGQGAAAFLTLVAVRAVRLAFGAGAGDVSVREELVRFRVVELGFRLDFKAAFLEQGEEKSWATPWWRSLDVRE